MGEIEKRATATGLEALAGRINEKHRAFVGSLKKTAEVGIEAGELLTEAKNECPHGTWLDWLKENFEGSARSAQVYMRMYRNRDKIRSKYAEPAHLSIGGALKELSAPKKEPTGLEEAVAEEEWREHVEGWWAKAGQPLTLKAGEEAPSDTSGLSVDPQHRAQPDNPRPWLGPRAADTDEEPDSELKELLDSVSNHEERVAETRERSRAREEREYEASRKNHGARFVETNAELSKARRAGKNALGQIRAVEFTAEELELLERELEAAQRMLRLVGAALTGDSGTDWDAELADLEERRQYGEER